MRTELCDLFGIDVPIFAFTHCRDVVVAVSKAGGFGVLGAVGFPPEQLETELAEYDLATAEHDPALHLVTVDQELARTLQLEVQIVIGDARSEFDLLDLSLVLGLLGGRRLLLLLVLEPPVIHDLADRRAGLGRDLHQVQARALGHVLRSIGGHDSQLLAVLESLALVKPSGNVNYLDLMERVTPLLPEGGCVALIFNRARFDADRFTAVWSRWRRRGIRTVAWVIEDGGLVPMDSWPGEDSDADRIEPTLETLGVPCTPVGSREEAVV